MALEAVAGHGQALFGEAAQVGHLPVLRVKHKGAGFGEGFKGLHAVGHQLERAEVGDVHVDDRGGLFLFGLFDPGCAAGKDFAQFDADVRGHHDAVGVAAGVVDLREQRLEHGLGGHAGGSGGAGGGRTVGLGARARIVGLHPAGQAGHQAAVCGAVVGAGHLVLQQGVFHVLFQFLGAQGHLIGVLFGDARLLDGLGRARHVDGLFENLGLVGKFRGDAGGKVGAVRAFQGRVFGRAGQGVGLPLVQGLTGGGLAAHGQKGRVGGSHVENRVHEIAGLALDARVFKLS